MTCFTSLPALDKEEEKRLRKGVSELRDIQEEVEAFTPATRLSMGDYVPSGMKRVSEEGCVAALSVANIHRAVDADGDYYQIPIYGGSAHRALKAVINFDENRRHHLKLSPTNSGRSGPWKGHSNAVASEHVMEQLPHFGRVQVCGHRLGDMTTDPNLRLRIDLVVQLLALRTEGSRPPEFSDDLQKEFV